MKNYNLKEKINFSNEKPIKKDFLQADGFEAALICLKSGGKYRFILKTMLYY